MSGAGSAQSPASLFDLLSWLITAVGYESYTVAKGGGVSTGHLRKLQQIYLLKMAQAATKGRCSCHDQFLSPSKQRLNKSVRRAI